MPEWMDNSFWATVALALFIGALIAVGIPRVIGQMLDKRIAQIAAELEAAKRLREEAEALLVEYEQKRVAAEKEAEDLVLAARRDAERMTTEAQAALSDLVMRRTKSVEDKIAQAEAQAIAEVRARSADLAIDAARVILTKEVAARGDVLVDRSIADVGQKLN